MNNDIIKFSSSMAESYSDSIAERLAKEAKEKADKVIKHIDRRYEKEIKRAINANRNTRRTVFTLSPFLKIKQEIWGDVNDIVRSHYKGLGFSVSLENAGTLCECLFDRLCNGKVEVTIIW